MPLYDYRCPKCGKVYEHYVKPGTFLDVHCSCSGKHELTACDRLFPAPHFRVTGFNAKNGYNLPKESDLLNPDGTNKVGLKM